MATEKREPDLKDVSIKARELEMATQRFDEAKHNFDVTHKAFVKAQEKLAGATVDKEEAEKSLLSTIKGVK